MWEPNDDVTQGEPTMRIRSVASRSAGAGARYQRSSRSDRPEVAVMDGTPWTVVSTGSTSPAKTLSRRSVTTCTVAVARTCLGEPLGHLVAECRCGGVPRPDCPPHGV